MKYLSVCSGIEAATVAWHPLGWEPLAFSEIEPFPRKVLAHHYPNVPCHGDFTILRDQDWIVDTDLLVGGTPCQAFSVAGLRQSLSDDRGNLTLEFVRLADAIDNLRRIRGDKPAVIVWENVPGVLSVQDNAFGCFLAALVGNDAPLVPTGGKWTNAGLVVGPKRSAAWRVLDAQYFGVAQRRRRVFVVAGSGNGFDPAEILFEREGMRRDTAPSRKAREDVAAYTSSSIGGYREGIGTLRANGGDIGGGSENLIAKCLPGGVGQRYDPETESLIVHGTQDPCVSDIAFAQGRNNGGENVLVQPIAFNSKDYGSDATTDMSPTLRSLGAYDANGGGSMAVAQAMAVRRLTPRECERLQGFPDDYTAIPNAADGPRYKALGNSMAVPVMRWIGQQVQKHILPLQPDI